MSEYSEIFAKYKKKFQLLYYNLADHVLEIGIFMDPHVAHLCLD